MKNVTKWGYAVLLAMTSVACAEQQAPVVASTGTQQWAAGYVTPEGSFELQDVAATKAECIKLIDGINGASCHKLAKDAQVVVYMGDDSSNETVVVAVCDELTCNRMAEALNTVQPGTYYVETR